MDTFEKEIVKQINAKGCLEFPFNFHGDIAAKGTVEGTEIEKLAADNGIGLCSAKMEADGKAQKEAETKAASEKVTEHEEALIALTKSHFRHIARSLMYEDFEARYFNHNTPLHIIFSLNEDTPTLLVIERLQELFNDGKIEGDDLRNIFEAKNAANVTPIEILLENPVHTIRTVFRDIKHLGFLDRFVASFMANIMAELNLAVDEHNKLDIQTRTSELYKVVQSNHVSKTKFLDLVNIESINHAATEIYSNDTIKDKLKLIEQKEKLRIDGLIEQDINMFNIELSFNRIADLNTTFYKSGLLANDFGFKVVKAIKVKLNIVLNKAIQRVKLANEEQLKDVYRIALENLKQYETFYKRRGFDDLEQPLKNAVGNRVSDFLHGVCKAQEEYRSQQEAGECWDKLYALKQQYGFLRNDLCLVQKIAGDRYIEGSVQNINDGTNVFSEFICKEKTSAIYIPLAIAGAVGLYISGAGIAGAALASGVFLLGLDVYKEMDAIHSIFIGSSIGTAIVGLSYIEHGAVYASKAATLGSVIGAALTGLGEIVGAVTDKALDCE